MRKDKIISLVFVGILLAGFLWNILTPVRAYSERENRYLQGRPTLSMDRVLSGQFGKDFETYTTDQFPMRDAWVSLKTMAGLAMLRPDNGRVYFGKQHRLFEIPEPADAALQEKNCLAVAGFLEKVTREYPEIRASVLLAPTATTVLEGALPARRSPMKRVSSSGSAARSANPSFSATPRRLCSANWTGRASTTVPITTGPREARSSPIRRFSRRRERRRWKNGISG